jgi:hypothetical protein
MMRVFIALALVAAIPCAAFAETWYIKPDGTGDAPTIQAGVDSAGVGDTVLVAPGTYADTTHVLVAGELRAVNVSIDKNIVLLGETSPAEVLVDGADSEICVYLSGVDATCTVARFSIFREWVAWGCIVPAKPDQPAAEQRVQIPFESGGIYCEGADATIAENLFYDLKLCIMLDGSFPTIVDSEIRDVPTGVAMRQGVASGGEIIGNRFANYAVGIYAVHPLHIEDNVFTTNHPGGACTSIDDWSSSTIENNLFESVSNEAIAMGVGSTIVGNRFRDCYRGVWGVSGGGTVSGNVFYDIFSYGVETSNSGPATYENNTFDGCAAAFVFWVPAYEQAVRRNIIVNSQSALGCYPWAPIVFECNNIFNTTFDPSAQCLATINQQHNFSADPEFCGIPGSGLYTLQSDSPCAPGNHPDGVDCGLIGALPVGCGEVEAKAKSWGQIKAMMRSRRNGDSR